MNPPATINDLPPEMIWELFKHLPLKDILACSRVNKRWHSIVDNFKVHTLAVVNDQFAHIGKWTYLNRRFRDHEMCDAKLFNRLANHPRSKHLKRLALLVCEEEVNSNKLKSFSQLQHLETVRDHSEKDFNHSELEVLVFHHSNFYRLSIDCPKLRVLVYEEPQPSNLLDVKHPETIRKLQTNMFGPKLDRFKGVECLVTRRIEAISRATLQSLPALKKLHFDEDIQSAFSNFRPYTAGALDRMKRRLSEFLGHVKQLKRADLQFRFAGFELTDITLDQIDFDMQVEKGQETVYNESVYLKNYHLIEPDALHFIREVNYSRLMNNVAGDLPACFFEKFAGVDEVCTSAAVQDDRHFRWFLKSLRQSCTSLWLAYSQLGADFFKYHLQRLVPSLDTLSMSAYDPTGLLFDFDFLYELPRLSRLSIWGALSLETVRSLVDLFEDLEDTQVDFEFECKDRSVGVEKRRYCCEWYVYEEDREAVEICNQAELFDCLEAFQTWWF